MKRILAVDDDRELAGLIRDALTFMGHEVEIAFSGEECLEKVEDFGPDMILLDIMMPNMDGWEVLEELRTRGICERSKIAMLTARPLSRNDISRRGFDELVHYIHKPISMKGLSQEIENIFVEEGRVVTESREASRSLGEDFAGKYEEIISDGLRKKRILSNLFLSDAQKTLIRTPKDIRKLIMSVDRIEEEMKNIRSFFSPLASFFLFGIENELNRIRGVLGDLLDREAGGDPSSK